MFAGSRPLQVELRPSVSKWYCDNFDTASAGFAKSLRAPLPYPGPLLTESSSTWCLRASEDLKGSVPARPPATNLPTLPQKPQDLGGQEEGRPVLMETCLGLACVKSAASCRAVLVTVGQRCGKSLQKGNSS